jgi:hypothetical protein
VPFLRERRRDEADRGRVEAVSRDNQKAQNQYKPLIRRETPFIDELLHVKRA